jgi:hypothetical protein
MKNNSLVFLGFALICLVNMKYGSHSDKAAQPAVSPAKIVAKSTAASTAATPKKKAKLPEGPSEASDAAAEISDAKMGASERPL